jgi:hypothetical protein
MTRVTRERNMWIDRIDAGIWMWLAGGLRLVGGRGLGVCHTLGGLDHAGVTRR